MKAQGLGASEIAKALQIGRASVYRVLEAIRIDGSRVASE
jgi:transposase